MISSLVPSYTHNTFMIFIPSSFDAYYPVKSYEDEYIKWTTLQQGRDQDVPEFINLFHTLHTKLGIKDSEKHLILKYRGCLHKYIQEEIEFFNISSLGTTNRYAVKVEQTFKQKKRDFGSANPKQGKGAPKPQKKGQSQGGATQDNLPKLQPKNSAAKSKKDTRKWCEFHKSSMHNTSECRAKQSLVAELKVSKSDACSNSKSKPDKGNDKGKHIIDADPNATVATAKIQKNELEDPEEEEHLFHSQMWVKGSSLQFIVDSWSQKNLISAEVVKRWAYQPQHIHNRTPSGGFTKDEIFAIPEVALPTAISLITVKQCSKLISKNGKFVFLMICPQRKKKTVATASRRGPSARQLQMDKVVEEYGDIFTSPAGVPLHCQVKHSIDLTPELRSFLGLANFYRRFVLGFPHITWPLSQVTKGGAKAKFFWSESQQKVFIELKDRLCMALVLALPDLQQPFEVETDASDYAIGAVLTQHGHPVAYHSEALSYTVRKYPTYDKEMYSIVQACLQWKHYIFGKEMVIHTDHQPL
eukprot:PITA_27104